jgi:hypothetical protein
MSKQLFVLAGGVEKGPFSTAEVVEMVGKGELTPSDALRGGGETRWVRLGKIDTLADLFESFTAARRQVEALFETNEAETPALTCPRCGAPAAGDSLFCTTCGVNLGPDEPSPDEKTCPQCGLPSSPDACYCTACGRRLDASADDPPVSRSYEGSSGPSPSRKAGRSGVAGKILAFGAGAVILIFVLLAIGVIADRLDNDRIDFSLIGAVDDAPETPESPPPEVRPAGGEEEAGNPTMSFVVLSAYGGGRSHRDVMDALTANGDAIRGALADGGGGAVAVRITVARNGAVVGAEAREATFEDPAIVDKVTSAVRSCRLEPAEGTTVAVVRLEYST